MEERPGGQGAADADLVNRLTAETVAARGARVAGWVFIALGVGCVLFGGLFFAAKHSGHDVTAAVTQVGPCSDGDVCTVTVVYDTPDGQFSAVMYGVPGGEVYGRPGHRLLNVNYQSAGDTPTTNDMPDAIWIGFGAAGLACAGFGAWWLRRKASPQLLTGIAHAADGAVSMPAPAGQRGPGDPAPGPGHGPARVDGWPGTVTIANREPRWLAVLTLLMVAVLVGCVGAQYFSTRLGGGRVPATVACLVIAAAVLTWGCSRALRIGLGLGEDGVTVRNAFRTYRASWPEVLCFADGSVSRGESGRVWALDVVLRDGRVVTATGTSGGKRDAHAENLAAIRQAAERHAIPAELTGTATKRGSRGTPANSGLYPDPGGQPGLRAWNGTTWSPFLLRADPASATAGSLKAPAEVWSPLAGSDSHWHHAAPQARRAGIMIAVWLAVTGVAGAVTVALYARDLSRPQADFTLAVFALCATGLALMMALAAWDRRKNLKKIDRAGKAAASAQGASDDR